MDFTMSVDGTEVDVRVLGGAIPEQGDLRDVLTLTFGIMDCLANMESDMETLEELADDISYNPYEIGEAYLNMLAQYGVAGTALNEFKERGVTIGKPLEGALKDCLVTLGFITNGEEGVKLITDELGDIFDEVFEDGELDD